MLPVILRKRRWFRVALLIAVGYAAFYLSGIDEQEQHQYYSYSLDGRDNAGSDPISLWQQRSLADLVVPPAYRLQKIADEQAAMGLASFAQYGSVPISREAEASGRERQVTRNASIHLLVSDLTGAVEKIGGLTDRAGGYVLSSQIGTGRAGERGAVVTVRIPASRLDEVRAEIRKSAVQVESERIDAKDVTKDFVDSRSTLRNYRAEEAQYLAVMKRAVATKDILDVSQKLSDVRGRIEKIQGELQYLSHQIEMATVSVYLDAESQAQIFGVRWRPLYRIKLAFHDGVEAVGNYFSMVVALVLRLPVILLWLVTLFILAAIGWRLVSWMAKLLFPKTTPATSSNASNSSVG